MDQEFQQMIMNNPIFRSQLPTLFNAAALQVTQQAHQVSQHLNQGGRAPGDSSGSPANPSPQQGGHPGQGDQCSPNPATPQGQNRTTRDKEQSPPPGTPQGTPNNSNPSNQENQLIQAVARQAALLQHQTNSLLK